MAKVKAKSKVSLENLLTLNIEIKLLIEDCKFGTDFEALTKKAYQQLWESLVNSMSNIIIQKEQTEINEVRLWETLILVEKAIQNDSTRAGSCPPFVKLVSLLNRTLQLNENCKNMACKINEYWLKCDLPPVPNMIEFTLEYLLNVVQQAKKTLPGDLKRLYSFRTHVTTEILETHQNIINSFVLNPTFVGMENGQKFLGFVCSLSGPLLKFVCNAMKFELRTCSKKIAEMYGAIMLIAWNKATDEIKPEVQARFQDLMEAFIKVPRSSLELSQHARNLMIIISGWNVEVRKNGNNLFNYMMMECYKPIIWKYLQSGINFERCNAVDLLMKAYPLQVPGDSEEDSDLFLKQLRHMEEVLKDDCPVIRIIAVREICNILSIYWTQFSSVQIRKLLTVIINEHAADSSSFDVRKTVWRSFKSFISSQPAFNYMKQFLPSLGRYFNDVNATVRMEFIELLTAIRENNDPTFKFTEIVPRPQLLAALAKEGNKVGSVIVKLLLSDYYNSTMENNDWIRKFCRLISSHPDAYRNFFMFSKKVLPFEDAHKIMCELITYLGGYIKKKSETMYESENDENDSSVGNVERTSMFDKSRSMVQPGVVECAFDNPKIIVAIFDIVTILWVVHNQSLLEVDNKNKLKELHVAYMRFAPCFVSYFKGSDLMNSVITLSGNVPASILNSGSITLPSYCTKRLKTTKIDCGPKEDAENLSMMIALVKWGRSGSILEYISLWLQDAFDSYHSTLEKGIRKVQITETIEPNSELAIHLLDLLLRTEYTKNDIMRKNHSQLCELWKNMEHIKEIIFRRLLQGRPYSQPLLSDLFLESCFKRYAKLIPLLNKKKKEKKEDENIEEIEVKEPSFDSNAEILTLLKFTKDDLLPMLQSEESNDLPLLTSLIKNVLCVSDNMIMVQLADFEVYTKLGGVIISVLNMEHNLHFVQSASRIAAAFSYAERVRKITHGKDDWHLRSRIVPSVLFHTLNAMVSRPYSPEDLAPFKQDFQVVKTNIGKILRAYEENFEMNSRSRDNLRLLQLIMEKMLQAVRVVLTRDIPNEQMAVTVYSSFVKLHPAVAVVLSGFYDKTFWTPMFLHFLKQNLGHTIKILLADITVLYLFAKSEKKTWRLHVNNVMEAATIRLKMFKADRKKVERKSMGVTLSHVDDISDDGNTGEEVELRESQVTSAAVLERRTGSGSTFAGRGSEPCSNMATIATESRTSEPCSNMATIPTESRTSEPMECEKEIESILPSSQILTQLSQPLSNVATQGSQPNEIIAVPATPERNKQVIDEDDLIDDFILCGEDLLSSIKTFITTVADTTK